MLPLLEFASDGAVHSLTEAREQLAMRFGLTSEEVEELLPSGRQRRFANRVAWAKVYLERACILGSSSRGQFQITGRGREILANPPAAIDIKYLARFPEYVAFRAKSAPASAEATQGTPEEQLDAAFQGIRDSLASELLDRLKTSVPTFFERAVVELLLKMGYGKAGGGQAIGRTGDEGIDGIISEDLLGLDQVYVQAKRWAGTVGRPEIQRFVGALHGRHARKGVFMTTGVFSEEARRYVASIDPKVALIDGPRLADLMIDFDLGVSPERTYVVKKLDSDYFEQQF